MQSRTRRASADMEADGEGALHVAQSLDSEKEALPPLRKPTDTQTCWAWNTHHQQSHTPNPKHIHSRGNT